MSKTETQSEAQKLSALLNVAMAFDHGRIGTDRRFVEMDATVVASVDAELRRLDAENKALRERLEIATSHPIDGIAARDETIRQLEAQIKELRIKAARYDYIKQFGTSGETKTLTHPRQVVYASIGFHGHELGAAIDARIAEKAAAKTGEAA